MDSPLRRLLRRKAPGNGEFTRQLEQYVPGNSLVLLTRGIDVYEAMLCSRLK